MIPVRRVFVALGARPTPEITVAWGSLVRPAPRGHGGSVRVSVRRKTAKRPGCSRGAGQDRLAPRRPSPRPADASDGAVEQGGSAGADRPPRGRWGRWVVSGEWVVNRFFTAVNEVFTRVNCSVPRHKKCRPVPTACRVGVAPQRTDHAGTGPATGTPDARAIWPSDKSCRRNDKVCRGRCAKAGCPRSAPAAARSSRPTLYSTRTTARRPPARP